jgi:hypothetical protein
MRLADLADRAFADYEIREVVDLRDAVGGFALSLFSRRA